MKNAEVTVVVSIYEGGLDEVAVFNDHRKGQAYYDTQVKEVFGSETEYQQSLEDGVPDQLFYIEHIGLK